MKIDRKSPQTHRVGGMGIASSKWTAGKGRRPFAPRRWARYVLVGFKRVTMDMFRSGEALGKGSGRVKGRGEKPEGEAGRELLTGLGVPRALAIRCRPTATRVRSVLMTVKDHRWVLVVVRWIGTGIRR